jgi:hypothetical protein
MRPALTVLLTGRRWVLLAVALALVLLAAAILRARPAAPPAAPPRAAGVPGVVELIPGQEAALESLLGRGDALPGGCRYDGADLTTTHLTARYACPAAPGVHALDLYVDARERNFVLHAGRFAVEVSPRFPDPLRDALLARIGERSQRLHWRFRGERNGLPGAASPRPSARSPVPVASAPVGHERTWTRRDTARLFDHDPTLGFLAALGFILAFTARQLRRDPWQVAAALALIVALGLAFRLRLAVAAPMNAHPFTRLIPQAMDLFCGPVMSWLTGRLHLTVYFTDFQGWFNLALSALMPLVFFTHARLLFDDARKALVAAALMALLPMHIRFAKSDVIFVLSLVNSSLTFATIYGALSDPSRAWRVVCSVALPVLSVATYLSRPENYVFALLDLGALALYLRADVPRRRVALAAVAIAGAAGYAVATDLLTRYGQNVSEGLSLRTFVHAWEIATDLQYNTLLNVSMTPPPLPALALVGVVTLWRGGERRKAVFLVGWLVSFFVVNSYVRAPTVTMQARYHLNLVSPLVLLAAAALPAVRRLPDLAQGALVAWLALSPVLHREFIRDVDFTEAHEHAFLRRHRHLFRTQCTVLEFGPAFDLPAARYTLGLRAPRLSLVLRDGATGEATGRQIGAFPPGGGAEALEDFSLPAAVVARPPPCTYYYESAACWTHGPSPGARAPACEAMHQRFRLTLVGEEHHPLRPLDDIILVRAYTAPDGSRSMRRVATDRRDLHLALYRVDAR